MKKWFNKISDLFKGSGLLMFEDSATEEMLNAYCKSHEHKISCDTYKKLMFEHEVFHFDGKDWIIFNICSDMKEEKFCDYYILYNNINLKLRSIEDDPRMSLELDCVAHEFENKIDVDKYIDEEDNNDERQHNN